MFFPTIFGYFFKNPRVTRFMVFLIVPNSLQDQVVDDWPSQGKETR